jgi:thiosulfate/3-mercaptopyruvate sulfurtransferase
MMRFLALALSAVCIAVPAASQPLPGNGAPRAALVVDTAWLAAHLRDPNLVLLQVGTRETYDREHIPGARFGDPAGLRNRSDAPGALTLEMPPPDALRTALESLGISDTSHVVVYASDEYWTPSTRVMLTLDYAGLDNVSYLDGGLKAWIASGQAVSPDAPRPARGTLAPLKVRPVIVDAAFVQAHVHAPGFVIVDARKSEFYDGTTGGGQRGQTKKFGHIPGAVNAPFDAFASEDGHLKPKEEIAAVFEKAGVKRGDTVITYCHIGQQATATLLAARTVGFTVLLYDGSFEDWNARNLPLELPAKKDK